MRRIKKGVSKSDENHPVFRSFDPEHDHHTTTLALPVNPLDIICSMPSDSRLSKINLQKLNETDRTVVAFTLGQLTKMQERSHA